MNLLEKALYTDKPTVVILAGGRGTRLYPLTLNKPKPLTPLVNRPILLLTMENLARQGCYDFIFSVKDEENYSKVKDYFKYGEGFSRRLELEKDVRFKYQPKYDDAGDADGFRSCIEFYNVENDTLVIGGDNIADLELDEMIKFHKKNDALVTIALKSKEDVTGLGVVVLDDNYRVTNFVEKPQKEEVISNLVNAGIYLFSPKIREVLKNNEIEKMINDRRFGFGRNLFPHLLKKGERVFGYLFPGLWSDVGTIDSFIETTTDILHGSYENIKLRNEYKKGIWIHHSTLERIKNKNIKLIPPVTIGGDCEIGDNVTIQKNSVIGDNCIIGKNVQVNASTIMHCSNIGDNAKLTGSIVGTYSEILSSESSPTVVDVNAVIGNDTTIKKGSVIRANERVAPLRYMHEILTVKVGEKQLFREYGKDELNFYFSD
jgi:NDP-sugar pyrophosphorylase family protein